MPILPNAIHICNAIPTIQITHGITHRTKITPKFVRDQNTSWIAKATLRNKNTVGGIMGPDFKLLQSYSTQNSMVLAPKKTHRSMKQNRECLHKPISIWSINLWQRKQANTMGTKFFNNCVGKTGRLRTKE